MNNIVILGAGGFAREVMWLIEDIGGYNIMGFLDDNEENHGKHIHGYPILGPISWLKNNPASCAAMGVGSPETKQDFFARVGSYARWPNLIHPNVEIGHRTTMDEGVIICAGNTLTVDIHLEDFVTLNLHCTVGHDAIVQKFCTILPGVHISGGTKIGAWVSMGTGSLIIENKKIGHNTTIGAGAVVVKDIPANCTAVGTPAKPLER